MNPKNIVCSIFEKDYDYGLGALVNSLVRVRFDGLVIVYFGQKLPFWANQLVPLEDNLFEISNSFKIEFREIDFEEHNCFFKPFAINILLGEYSDSNIFYFDPDITVTADWSFFEYWVGCGIALCMDQSYPIIPMNHPIKSMWQDSFKKLKIPISKNLTDYYVNSGFIGINCRNKKLIETWIAFTISLKDDTHSLKQFGPTKKIFVLQNRANAFCGDQDILNAAIMYSDVTYSIIGQEGMGFMPGGYSMYHNTGMKTWRKRFMLEFLKNGTHFSDADSSYFTNSHKPINLYRPFTRALIKFDILITKFLQKIL